MQQILKAVAAEHRNECNQVIKALGTDAAVDLAVDVVAKAQAALVSEFNVTHRRTNGAGLEGSIMSSLCKAASDPDIEVPKSCTTYTPLGKERAIRPCGVFPLLTVEDANRAQRNYAPLHVSHGPYVNYQLYDENKENATV